MIPERIEDVAVLAKDTSTMGADELELRNVFKSRAEDLWEMMASVCGYGCNAVVVKTSKTVIRYLTLMLRKIPRPDYPVKVSYLTGYVECILWCLSGRVQHPTIHCPLPSVEARRHR